MKKNIITLLLCSSFLHAFSQINLPSNTEVGVPKIVQDNIFKMSDVKSVESGDHGQSKKSNKFWRVYSDRENNTTYTSPGGSSVCTKLEFNEPLRIAKISGDYALVYTEPVKSIEYPKISADAVSKGWISFKNLLLWDKCPTNQKLVYNKALIMMNLDEKQDLQKLALCYKTPSSSGVGEQLVTDMKFYFVMKEVGNMSLLATSHMMGGSTDKVLYGWVNKSHYIPWDQRSCLEPNWNPEASHDFAMRGVKGTIYGNSQFSDPKCTLPLGRVNGLKGTTDADRYRLDPYIMRFPLIEAMDAYNDSYHCMAFGGNGIIDVRSTGGSGKIIDATLTKKSNINIIVVIDGTNSMRDFYSPMQKAIQDANMYFDSQSRKVKVGVVIYRNKADGSFETEYLPMKSPSDAILKAFLQSGGKYRDAKHTDNGVFSVGKTWTESLYKGLDVALDHGKLGYSPDESNMMFVIGDCGNALDDKGSPTPNTIKKKLADNNIQLASFQVRNPNQQSFLLFRKQMFDFVRDNLRAQYLKGMKALKQEKLDRLLNAQEIKELENTLKTHVGLKEVEGGYDGIAKQDKNFFAGSIRSAATEQEMPAGELYKLVKDRYEQFGAIVDLWTEEIWKAGTTLSGGGNGGTMNEEFLRTLFTPEQIRILKENASLMAVSGYAKKREEKYDLWKPVLYISQEELSNLRKTFNDMKSASIRGGNTDRKPFIHVVEEIARTQTQGDYSKLSLEEIIAAMSGANISTKSVTGNHTLKELGDEKAVPQREFDKLTQAMVKVANKLDRIASNGEKYLFRIHRNNTYFYWLPAEDLLPTQDAE